jgi:diguanylate cyclase (GGDEF)-like protein
VWAALEKNPLAFWAGLSRVLLGVMFVGLQPLVAPTMGHWWWGFFAYLLIALVGQYMISRDMAGQLRVIGFGLIDIAVITFIVHRMGSVSTTMASLYIFHGVVNALVVKRRAALALALLGSLSYLAILIAEWEGWLAHAPDAISATHGELGGRAAAASALVVAMLTIASTLVVSRLVRSIRRRERQLVRANEMLHNLAERDPLTQLYNRRYLLDRIDYELARVRRGHPLALLLVDLDGFKAVNDVHGHLEGDHVLRRVAAVFKRATRETDVVGRFGGDEFVIVLPDSDPDQARNVADRLVVDVRAECGTPDAKTPITASVGLGVAAAEDSANDLVGRADRAVYLAKAAGGDQIAVEK